MNSCTVENIDCHQDEQIMESEECSELDTTSTAVMFSNNHHVTTIMDTCSMMDKKYFIYCYFSSTFEVTSNLFLLILALITAL